MEADGLYFKGNAELFSIMFILKPRFSKKFCFDQPNGFMLKVGTGFGLGYTKLSGGGGGSGGTEWLEPPSWGGGGVRTDWFEPPSWGYVDVQTCLGRYVLPYPLVHPWYLLYLLYLLYWLYLRVSFACTVCSTDWTTVL
jgi:hypothetical protein